MPQVKIKEIDNTTAPISEYANFAVVVPGLVAAGKDASVFDANGICEFDSQADFVDKIGLCEAITEDLGNGDEKIVQMGNQIAYELLGLGYPVLYKKLEVTESEEEENENSEPDYLTCLTSDDFWAPLKDKATYDFRFIINGLLNNNADANKAMAQVAIYDNKAVSILETGRGDCVALCDVDDSKYAESSVKSNRLALYQAIKDEVNDYMFSLTTAGSKYVAFFAPSVCLMGVDDPKGAFDGNNRFPASFYYLACFKKAVDNGFAEWYAAAGYTRGICKYTIEAADINFGEYLINALEPRSKARLSGEGSEEKGLNFAINVIAKIRGNYYLWGNRTAEDLETDGDLKASHFLNIRQLCSTLKKQIYVACRKFTFDPNSDVLWINFCNAIKPTLERMKADQGIKDYKIVKLYTAKKAELKAKVRIIPIEAVEDFDIEISLEDNFGSTQATAVER